MPTIADLTETAPEKLPACTFCTYGIWLALSWNYSGAKNMEIRMILSDEAEAFVKKLTDQRKTSAGVAIDRLIVEVARKGGIAITDHIKSSDADLSPPL